MPTIVVLPTVLCSGTIILADFTIYPILMLQVAMTLALTPLVQEHCHKKQWGRLSDLLLWMKTQVIPTFPLSQQLFRTTNDYVLDVGLRPPFCFSANRSMATSLTYSCKKVPVHINETEQCQTCYSHYATACFLCYLNMQDLTPDQALLRSVQDSFRTTVHWREVTTLVTFWRRELD